MAGQAELIRRKDLSTRYSIPASTLTALRNPNSACFDPAFPSPFRIGRQALAWRIAEVEEWLESRRVGPSAPAGWWSQHVCLYRIEHDALTGVTRAFNRNGDTLAEFYAILPPPVLTRLNASGAGAYAKRAQWLDRIERFDGEQDRDAALAQGIGVVAIRDLLGDNELLVNLAWLVIDQPGGPRHAVVMTENYETLLQRRHRDVYGESVAPTIGELLGDRDIEQVLRARRDELEIVGLSVVPSDDSVKLSFNDPYLAEASRVERMRSIDI